MYVSYLCPNVPFITFITSNKDTAPEGPCLGFGPGLLDGTLGEDSLEVLAGEAPTAVWLFAAEASQGRKRGAQPEQAEAADDVGGA